VILAILELKFEQSNKAPVIDKPDLSVRHAITDYVIFMPGVSVSLVCFVVFGTTHTFREYLWTKLAPRNLQIKRTQRRANRLPSVVVRIPGQKPQDHIYLITEPPSPLSRNDHESPVVSFKEPQCDETGWVVDRGGDMHSWEVERTLHNAV